MKSQVIDIAKIVGLIALCVTIAGATWKLNDSIGLKFDAVLKEMKVMNEFIMRHDERIEVTTGRVNKLESKIEQIEHSRESRKK